MKLWQFAVLGSLCLALPACRSRPNQTVSLLERELRDQEDEIHRLKKRLERCQEEAAFASSEGSASEPPRRDETGPKLFLDFSRAKRTEGISRPPNPTPKTSEPGAAPPWDGSTPSSDSLPESLRMPHDGPATGTELPDLDVPGRSGPQGNESDPTVPADQVDNRQVQRIVLNPQLSGGYDADGMPGHEGIVVVVEPRDGHGRPIDAPAEASVVIIDPAIADETGRVARWDLTAAETARLFGRSGRDRGMQMALRWPAGPPIHSDVLLFVRYTTSDGRMLQADMPMRIDLPEVERPAKNTLGWTRAEPSPRVASNPPPTAIRARVPTLAIRPSPPPEVSSETPKEPAVAAGRPSWTPDRR